MNLPSRAAIAALNNAAWSDAVCRVHGGVTTLGDAVWVNAVPSPRFYANVITLRGGARAEVEAAVGRLDGRLRAGWGIKDSFAELELHALGFAMLFEAVWMWRGAAARDAGGRRDDGLSWTAASADGDLSDWERAWEAYLGDATTARAARRQFPPALLACEELVFVTGRRDGRVVAGGVLNAHAGVVGVSNVFAPPTDLAACWGRLVEEAAARFPGLPQCTYDRAPDTGLDPQTRSGHESGTDPATH